MSRLKRAYQSDNLQITVVRRKLDFSQLDADVIINGVSMSRMTRVCG
jgi:hypothetical protein